MNKLILRLIDSSNIDEEKYLHANLLTEADLEDIKKMKSETNRKEKIISSYFKNKYVGTYYLNNKGKPLSDNSFFNVSHSHGLVVFVKDDNYPIGVDVEKIEFIGSKMRRYISTETEYETIHSDEDFYRLWTNKESLVKALGTGIIFPMRNIPGLPINDFRDYSNKSFYSQTLKYKDFIISVTMETSERFEVVLVEELLPF